MREIKIHMQVLQAARRLTPRGIRGALPLVEGAS